MDLGSYAANTADFFVPGQPFSQGYNKMLRDQFGDQLIDKSGNGAAAAPTDQNTSTTPGKPTRPINRMGQGFDDPRLIDRDPSRQNLGASRDFTNELASVPANLPQGLRQGVIHKTVDANGRPVYSGINVGANAQFVDGKGQTITPRGSVETSSGPVAMGGGGYAFTPGSPLSQAEINTRQAQTAAALRNPDGSRWTANDNAIMAANLRDGIDPYRGTSRGNAQAQGGMSPGMASIAAAEQKLGVPLGKARRAQAALDQQGEIARMQNQTALRGHGPGRGADGSYLCGRA